MGLVSVLNLTAEGDADEHHEKKVSHNCQEAPSRVGCRSMADCQVKFLCLIYKADASKTKQTPSSSTHLLHSAGLEFPHELLHQRQMNQLWHLLINSFPLNARQ